jgi:hypothetical protein
MSMKKLFSSMRMSLAAAGLAVLLFSSCRKSDDNLSQQQVSGLMVFNLVSDKPAGIGVTLSGNNITQVPIGYAGYTGGYTSVYSGSYSVQTYDAAGYQVPLTGTGNTFLPKKYYSLFVTGANGVYSNVFTEDNYDSLSAANGQAYIRYINAIPDSTDPRVTIAANGNAVSNNTAHYGSVSQFTQVAPGQVTINISNDATFQSNRTITLEGQKAYTVLLIGVPGSADANKAVQIKYVENGKLTD